MKRGVDTTWDGSSICLRIKFFSAACVRGQPECRVITNLSRNYITTKGETWGQGQERKDKQISSTAAASALIASQPTL